MQSSKPVSTSRCRVRETLDLLVSSASMICSSVHPSPASETSALSRMRARVTNSAERRPLRRNSSRKDRSSRLNFTMYFFSATNHLHASKQQGCLIHEYDSTSRKRDTSLKRVDKCTSSSVTAHGALRDDPGNGRRPDKLFVAVSVAAAAPQAQIPFFAA